MDELSYTPGLIQCGSVFHYRKRVPTDIVGSFGWREIWTSLGTGNRPEAIKRARRIAVELDDKFDAHRNGQVEPFRLLTGIMISVSNFERDLIKSRVKSDLESVRKRGVA